jgi:low temperature requirement protein LtrA
LASETLQPEQQEWFEIFFDLVFAVAVSFWAERVAKEPTFSTYFVSLGYLLPVWWIWLGQTVFAMRFGESALRYQALALAQVMAVGVMSIQLLHRDTPSTWFALGYVAARLALLAAYALARRKGARARAVANLYIVGFGAGASCWLLSLLVADRFRVVAWVVGLAVDFAVPWVGLKTLKVLPLDSRRLPDRVGTFTSLLLGVSIEGIIRGLSETGFAGAALPVALLSLLGIVLLWWIYAARVNRAVLRSVLGSGQTYLYCHFFIVLGVGTSSVGIRVMQEGGPVRQAAHGLALLAAGAVQWILGIVLIRQVVLRYRDRFWYAPFIGVALAVPLLAVWGVHRPPAALAGLVLLVLVLALTELRHGTTHSARGHPHGPASGLPGHEP